MPERAAERYCSTSILTGLFSAIAEVEAIEMRVYLGMSKQTVYASSLFSHVCPEATN